VQARGAVANVTSVSPTLDPIPDSRRQPIVVMFTSQSCRPCQQLWPLLEKVAKSYADRVVLTRVDVTDNWRLSMRYRVWALPTVLAFRKGRVVGRLVAPRSRAALDSLFASLVAMNDEAANTEL